MQVLTGRGLVALLGGAVLCLAPASALAAGSILGVGSATFGFHFDKLQNGAAVGISKGEIPSMHVMDPARLTRQSVSVTKSEMGLVPFMPRVNAQLYSAAKAAASHSLYAPRSFESYSGLAGTAVPPSPLQLVTGLTDNGIVCGYFGNGCQPPDMAVAASPDFIVQATNTAVAIYDKNGVMQFGFPIDFPTFFGVPSPTPKTCTFNGVGIPYTTDPRAFYDPNDKRFFVAMNALNGVVDVCPFSSRAYIAVSKTSNPTLGWFIYSVNSAVAHRHDLNDFTQLGFDSRAVYTGGNQFPCPVPNCIGVGNIPGFDGAWTIILDKHRMESGASIAAPNIVGPYLSTASQTCPGGGCLLDTVNPTTSVANLSQQPGATILTSADQSNPTLPCGPVTCRNIDVWGISSPLSDPVVSERTVTLPTFFVLAPNGDEPGRPGAIETSDNRISGTPTYTPFGGGRVSFGLETGVSFGSSVFPGWIWGVIGVRTSGGKLTSATLLESGTVAAPLITNSFPTTQQTPTGVLFVVSDVMSPATYPGWVYRRVGGLGPLGPARLVQPGLDIFLGSRWGDFEAASYDGFSTNNVWLASQYGNTNFDWGTSMAKVR